MAALSDGSGLGQGAKAGASYQADEARGVGCGLRARTGRHQRERAVPTQGHQGDAGTREAVGLERRYEDVPGGENPGLSSRAQSTFRAGLPLF